MYVAIHFAIVCGNESVHFLMVYICIVGDDIQLLNGEGWDPINRLSPPPFYSRFAITRVIVLESSYLFLAEGMYTSGYIT